MVDSSLEEIAAASSNNKDYNSSENGATNKWFDPQMKKFQDRQSGFDHGVLT